ncbi:MAG TPA: ABC transporter permease, partial [Blastocatellia bacterium]
MKRQKREKELEEEIQSHLQMAISDRMERGESAEEAESAARREFGNIGLIKETTRGMWSFAALETIWQDLRYGARMLMKTPGFTLTAILTLALGVGAVAAIFSVVDAVLLRPLPAHHPERLVALYTSGKDGAGYRTLTYSDYVYYRDNQKSLEGLAAYARVPVNWREGDRVEQIGSELVTGNFFAVLGLRAAAGRLFTVEDDRTPGAHPVAVISHRLWTKQFKADPGVIGKALNLNNNDYTIIGVAPAG